jgi:Fe-S cluster assembly ATP-binding protein
VSELRIDGLRATAGGAEILHGINLVVSSGEVHAVMGPNGSGKSTLSHVLMGRPGYEVIDGSVTLDGVDVLALEPWQRAHAGLFLALQYPTEVPGVSLQDMLEESFESQGRDRAAVVATVAAEAERIGSDVRLLQRSLNVDMSGGEKKRNETLQLAVLRPRIAILDELDSGLDIDALRACARRIEAATTEFDLGVLAITHYARLLTELKPDVIHILVRGEIRASGGPELADELEQSGYAIYAEDADEADAASPDEDPFADPLA